MKLRTALLPLLLVALTTEVADARRNRRIGGRAYVANGTFGAGLEFGSPFGLNGKYFLSDSGALNFGVGLDGYYRGDRDGLHLYLDYLWHPVSLANPAEFQLPLFIGVGGRLWNLYDNEFQDDAVAFGIRIPFGIAFDMNNIPLDFFLQITPTFDFYQGYRDNVGFWIDGSIGIRYWFN
jgi:hypothetical protein